MKYLYRLAVVLIGLGFVGTIVFLVLAPEIIPAHYNSAGEVDRTGSKYKYECPVSFYFSGDGWCFPLVGKTGRNQEVGERHLEREDFPLYGDW